MHYVLASHKALVRSPRIGGCTKYRESVGAACHELVFEQISLPSLLVLVIPLLLNSSYNEGKCCTSATDPVLDATNFFEYVHFPLDIPEQYQCPTIPCTVLGQPPESLLTKLLVLIGSNHHLRL